MRRELDIDPIEQLPQRLRGRCELSLEADTGVAAPVEVARIVAEEWKAALNLRITPNALSCVLAALDGETDPAKLGIDEGSEAWDRLQALHQDNGEVWEVEVTPSRSGTWSWLLVRNGETIVAPGVHLSRELAITAARSRARNIVGREGAGERIRLELEK